MRMVYPDPLIELELSNTNPTILVVENHKVFRDLLMNLWKQTQGEIGIISLSHLNRDVNIQKKTALIVNPFAISYNEKRILNRLYAEVDSLAKDQFYYDLCNLNSNIVAWIDTITQSLPYPLKYNLDIEVPALLKAYDFGFENNYVDVLEHLTNYLKLMHQVCSVEIFVFLNLKQYFSKEQLDQLYGMCMYEQIYLLDIEGYDIGNRLKTEFYVILDKDLCLITNN